VSPKISSLAVEELELQDEWNVDASEPHLKLVEKRQHSFKSASLNGLNDAILFSGSLTVSF